MNKKCVKKEQIHFYTSNSCKISKDFEGMKCVDYKYFYLTIGKIYTIWILEESATNSSQISRLQTLPL